LSFFLFFFKFGIYVGQQRLYFSWKNRKKQERRLWPCHYQLQAEKHT